MIRARSTPLSLAAALLAACSSEPPAPEPAPVEATEAAEKLAEVFCRSANGVSQGCEHQGGVARFQGQEVTFTATPTNFLSLRGRTIGMGASAQQLPGEVQLGLDVYVSLGGRPLLRGSVSHAASDLDLAVARAKVLDEAAQRFVVGRGVGLIDALAGGEQAAALGALGLEVAPQRVDGWLAWSSWPVVKGQGIDPDIGRKLGAQVASMAGAVGPLLSAAGTPTDGVHAVRILAKLGGGGAPGPCSILPPMSMAPGESVSVVPLTGSIEVDGLAVGDICDLREAVAWPLPRGGATLEWEQVVVVTRAPAAG